MFHQRLLLLNDKLVQCNPKHLGQLGDGLKVRAGFAGLIVGIGGVGQTEHCRDIVLGVAAGQAELAEVFTQEVFLVRHIDTPYFRL